MPSRYTFRLALDGRQVLYNSASGATITVAGTDAAALACRLTGPRRRVGSRRLGPALAASLVDGGFLISSDRDELADIRARFWLARRSTPMVLTLTTTMECNLGCYYCYEERSGSQLRLDDVGAVVAVAEQRLVASGCDSIHVDWYGGEPLLNLGFLECASFALQELAARSKVAYSASVISNGTSWPEDVAAFVTAHRIRQVQISFDGLKANHDRRRRYRRGYAPGQDASSFDRAVALVDRLLDHVRVDLRINVDRGNQGDVLPLIVFMRERGWFARRYAAVVQPARLSAFSERSSFMRRRELSLEEYDAIRAAVRDAVAAEVPVEEAETPDGMPVPRSSVCAALASASVVVGADGQVYRCGLQVGERHRAVGAIGVPAAAKASRASGKLLPVVGNDSQWWESFDPTDLPTCRRCSFLPICWAGCPKKHLEGDRHAIAEQGAYWRANLPRLIGVAAGLDVPSDYSFGESEQFRWD